MNLQATAIKHVIIDQCYQPLLHKFYQQKFKAEDFQTLNQELMQPSSAKRHESLVGIYHVYMANRALLTRMVASGLLFKLVFYLKEQQFPQLCFQALRILFFVVENRRITEHIINTGGVYSLLNLVRKDNHRVLVGVSLWTLAKMANHISGDSMNPTITVNEFIQLVEIPERAGQADSAILDLVIKLWRNNVLLRPEDVTRFHSFTLAEVGNANITDQGTLTGCFSLLNLRLKDTIKGMRAGNWELLRQTLANLQNKPIEVLSHYLHFLLTILVEVKEFMVFRLLLIKLDVFHTFQGVLNHPSELARRDFCTLVIMMLENRGEDSLQYFLGKQSVLIKFYYMIESDTALVKKEICFIFALLTSFPSEAVLLLYEEAKIVAIYLRLLKEQQDRNLLAVCLEALIEVLRYTEKMSLTTFNWFINYLKSEKVEETLVKIENETLQESVTIKKLVSLLREFFLEKVIETE